MGEANVPQVRERYAGLWEAIIERCNRQRRQKGLAELPQGELAERLGVGPAAISRVVRGNELPRSAALLMKIAQAYEARPEETRVLLVYASALVAADANEEAVASCFLSMFRPLFSEQGLARKVIKPREIAYHMLLDMGLPPSQAAKVAERVGEDTNPQEAMGWIVTALPDADAGDVLNTTKLKTLLATFNTYRNVAVVDFDSPFAETSPYLSRAESRGDCKARIWRAVPNVTVTRIDVLSKRSVKDRAHAGYEFIFLERGTGEFEIGGLRPVELSEGGRQLIAYRSSSPHTFTAGPNGARLYVTSYHPQSERKADSKHDPVDDVLKAAKVGFGG